MSKVARIKTALLTALLWTLEVLGALALAGFLALLVYVLLLRLGLALERAASIAVSLWPTFVVAIFTVALWRSTQAQAEATQAMKNLQEALARSELVPCLGLSVIKSNQPVQCNGSRPSGQPLIEVCNLARSGVLVKRVNVKDLGGVSVVRVERDTAVSLAPWRSLGAPSFSLAPGRCAFLCLDGIPSGSHDFKLEFEFASATKPEMKHQAVVFVNTTKGVTQGTHFFIMELTRVEGACG